MDFLNLTEDRLSVEEICKLVSSEKCGAVSMFVGMTRDNFEGKEVKNLEYEAYESMAIKVMKNICTTIRSKWEQVHNIAIHHRLGSVPVLEASVVIAISSPHRVDSIAAVQYCIENLKVLQFFDDGNEIEKSKEQICLDPHSVQISASHDEIRDRIKKYMDRKREQINMSNIKDFIGHNVTGDLNDVNQSTCARVDAVLLKSKDSKGHLKVKRTENSWGPQTKVESLALPKELLMDSDKYASSSTFGVEERLANLENSFNIVKPISSDVYSRLKKIEDKIADLEAISPEYSIFWSRKTAELDDSDTEMPTKKKSKFSSEEIWNRLKNLEKS